MEGKLVRNRGNKAQKHLVNVQIQVILDPKAKQGGHVLQNLSSINPRAKISSLKRKIEKDLGILQEMYSLSYLDACPLDDDSTLRDHFFVGGSQLRVQPWDMWQALLHYTYKGDLDSTLSCMNITGTTDWNRHCAWVTLFIASHRGHHNLVARLIKRAKDLLINRQSQTTGWTALHAAARMGHWRVLCILLDNGANVRIKDSNKLSAFDLAREYGHKKCENSLNFCQWNLQKHYIVQERSKDYDARKARKSAYRQAHLQTDSTITPLFRGPRGQIYTAATPNTVTLKHIKEFDKKREDETRKMVTVCDDQTGANAGNKYISPNGSSGRGGGSDEKFNFKYGWFDEQRARQLIPVTDELLTYTNPSANELYPRSLLNPNGFSLPSVKFAASPFAINPKSFEEKHITFPQWMESKQFNT